MVDLCFSVWMSPLFPRLSREGATASASQSDPTNFKQDLLVSYAMCTILHAINLVPYIIIFVHVHVQYYVQFITEGAYLILLCTKLLCKDSVLCHAVGVPECIWRISSE